MDVKMDVLQQTLEAYRGIAKAVEEKNPRKKYQVEPAVVYFELLQERMAQGNPILWAWLLVPPELFQGFSVTYICPEMLALLVPSIPGGDISRYLDIDDLPPEFCSINRLILGLAQTGDFAPPDMMVYAAQSPCSPATTYYSGTAHRYGCPSYFLDVPIFTDKRSVSYVAQELADMVSFLEECTGRKMDWPRVRQALRHSNESMSYLRKFLELRKQVPCRVTSRDLMVIRAAFIGLLGMPQLTEWMKRRYQAALDLGEKGERDVPVPEQARLVWVGNSPHSYPGIYGWVESEYGVSVATMVQLEYNTDPIEVDGDISKIYQGLAVKTLEMPMARHGRMAATYNIEETIRFAREYKADAAILAIHAGCRWLGTTAYNMKERLEEAVGIPVMNFEFDCIDKRFLPPDKIEARFREFFEVRLGIRPVGQPASLASA